MTSTLRLPAMALLLVLGALLATACGGSDTTTLTFTQDTPVLHDASDPEATVHYGGLSSYEAALRQDGKIVGELIGSRHTILEAADLAAWADRMHVPGHDKANPDEVLMLTMLVFELEAGTLIVEGQTLNTPAEHAQMLVGKPLERAIVGGTGDYRFSRGQLTTTRNADGTYTQALEIQG